jgi:predicted ArsR family transcriptional regulator
MWSELALPVLKWIQAHEGMPTSVTLGDIADAVGLTAEQVRTELGRLHGDRLIEMQLSKALRADPAGLWVFGARLTGAGARAIAEWPAWPMP